MQGEVWKIINNEKMRKNQYEISSLGRIRNINTGNVLKPFLTSNGYLRISVNDPRTPKKKNINISIHRLVAEAFLPNAQNKPEVNHKNGIKTDNRVDNLEWSTFSENRKHAYDTMLDPRGENRPNSKISNDDAHIISRLLSDGYRVKDIVLFMRRIKNNITARELESIIYDIKRGRVWTFIYRDYPIFFGNRKELLKYRICLLYASGYTNINMIYHILTTDFNHLSVTKNYIRNTIKEYKGSTTIESKIDKMYIHI